MPKIGKISVVFAPKSERIFRGFFSFSAFGGLGLFSDCFSSLFLNFCRAKHSFFGAFFSLRRSKIFFAFSGFLLHFFWFFLTFSGCFFAFIVGVFALVLFFFFLGLFPFLFLVFRGFFSGRFALLKTVQIQADWAFFPFLLC